MIKKIFQSQLNFLWLWLVVLSTIQAFGQSGNSCIAIETFTVPFVECGGENVAIPVSVSTDCDPIQYELYKLGEQSPILTRTTTDTSHVFILENVTTSDGGQYFVTVTTSQCNSCQTTSVTSSEQSLTVLDVEPQIFTGTDSIFNCANNQVILTAGSTNSNLSNLSFQWENGATTESIAINETGEYEVTVTVSLCSAATTITINENFELPTADAGETIAVQECNATITLDGSASTPSQDMGYEWQNPNGEVISTVATFDVPDPMLGIYTLTVTHPISKCTQTSTVEVIENIPDFPQAIVAPFEMLNCINEEIALNGSASTGPGLNFQWFDENGVLISSNSAIGVQEPGNYTLRVTDNRTCENDTIVTVLQDITPPNVNIDVAENIKICDGDEILVTAIGADTYDWSNQETTESVVLTEAGTYTVTGTNASNGCTAEATLQLEVQPLPAIEGLPDAVNVQDVEGEQINLTASSENATAFWEVIGVNNIDSTAANFLKAGDTQIPVTYSLATDRSGGLMEFLVWAEEDGCRSEPQIFRLSIFPQGQSIFIPDVFSPNEDGVNDTWEIIFANEGDASNFSLTIFNRSGGMVFQADDMSNAWQGQNCPDGTYYYQMIDKNSGEQRNGAVTLLRRGM